MKKLKVVGILAAVVLIGGVVSVPIINKASKGQQSDDHLPAFVISRCSCQIVLTWLFLMHCFQ